MSGDRGTTAGRALRPVGTLAPLVERGHVFATFPAAVAHAARYVADEPDLLGVMGPARRPHAFGPTTSSRGRAVH